MESVRSGLRQIMSDLLRARPAEEAVIMAWPLVCGKEVAARSHPVSFSEGTLIVEVPDAEWRNQLQSFAPRYLSGYQELLAGQVQKVEFKVKPSESSLRKASASAAKQNSARKKLPNG